jgi:hypothetical protein
VRVRDQAIREGVEICLPALGLSQTRTLSLFRATQDNELFVGRAAMLGWSFGLIGEVITGRGFLSQVRM